MRRSFLTTAAILLAPSVAFANEGAESSDALETMLFFLGVVTVAYVVTHFVSEWAQERFGFETGVEYIVLGAIVGPGFGLLDQATIGHLSPAIVLGTGSLGLLTGLQMGVRRLLRHTQAASGAMAAISLSTFLFVAALPMLGVMYFATAQTWAFLPHALALGAVAMVADQGLIRTMVAFMHARGAGMNFLLRVARLSSSIAVLLFGIIFCLEKNIAVLGFGETAFETGLLWYVTHLVVGGVLGLLFAAFLMRDFEEDKILTIILGIVIFSSGMAYYLELSPIVVNFMLGFVLANTSRQSGRIEELLLSIQRPLYIVLFFFAGAMLAFDIAWWAYLFFIPFVGLRIIGRSVGGFVASRVSKTARRYPPMGLALMAPGGLSVAMALDYMEVLDKTPEASSVYMTLILGIVVSEILSYRHTRSWLIDATDVAPAYAREEEE